MEKQLMWQFCHDCGDFVQVVTVEVDKSMLTWPFCSPCWSKYDPHIERKTRGERIKERILRLIGR